MSKGHLRPLHVPASDFARHDVPVAIWPEQTWQRLHDQRRPALDFNKQTHNRFTPSDCPVSVLYAGEDTRTCCLECFGDALYRRTDIGSARWRARILARILVPGLRVCDLRNPGVLTALRMDQAAVYSRDLTVPQAWAKAIMLHPARFDAIAYGSRFTGGVCLAIFGRTEIRKAIRVVSRIPFSSTELAADLIEEFTINLV